MYNNLLKKIGIILFLFTLMTLNSYSKSANFNVWGWDGKNWVMCDIICHGCGGAHFSGGEVTIQPPFTIYWSTGIREYDDDKPRTMFAVIGDKPNYIPRKMANNGKATKSFSSYLVSVESRNVFDIKIVDVEDNVEVLKVNNINAFAEKPGNRIKYNKLYIMKIGYRDEELQDEEAMFSVGEDGAISK